MTDLKLNLFLIFLSSCTLLMANHYYVSPDGSDAQNGLSLQTAFLTLQHASNQVTTGDTVSVVNGTYAGFDLRNTNGNMTSPIVFRAIGDSVVINQSGPIRQDGINLEFTDWIIIDGFQVIGMVNGGNGIRLVESDHCVVRNCYCENNDERGIFTGFTDDIIIEYNVCTGAVDEHGIYVSNSSDRPIIRYNVCYGNNRIGIHMNGDLSAGGDGIISDAEIYGNIIYDNNQAAGINLDGCLNPLVYNNLIYNNHFAQGIALFQGDGAIVTQGAKIYHNTIIVPDDGRWGILVKNGSNVQTEIKNNIIINQHAWRGSITIESTDQFTSDYNVLINSMSNSGDGSSISLANWQALGLDGQSLLFSQWSDYFVNHNTQDYQLIANSPARNAGTTIGLVGLDILGTNRPQGNQVDIGCYEWNDVTSSIDVQVERQNIILYPNPVVSEFRIKGMLGPFQLSVVNIMGQNVTEFQLTGPEAVISLEDLNAGTYLVRIQSLLFPDLSLVQRIVVPN